MRRWLLRLLLLLPLVAIAASLLWLRSSLPLSSGRLSVPGLTAEVRIARDAHGIPTITAANDRDAAFALGFVHAQDRLFQMDLMRHAGAGRLSEWFGARTLGFDRFMRTIGLYHAAEQQYALLSPDLRAALDAYAAGVNAYLAHRRGALPAEYYLLRISPEPWRPADTLVWGKLIALELAGNFRREIEHARVAQHVSPEDMQFLYLPYPSDGPTAVSSAALLKGMPLHQIEAALPRLVGPAFASNNWVVDGKHSVSGKPLLANDPHLRLSAPSFWYLAHIKTPTLDLAGVTAAGEPFIVLGHNQKIAWGFTNTESDVEDCFIERVDPTDPSRYLTPDGNAPFVLRHERIEVRGAEPVSFTVRETRHGPVISDIGGNYAKAASPGTVLALQATFLQGEDRTPQALWRMNRAGNWQQFRDALRDFVAPEQNMVYADVDGHIGFIAPGRVPIRGKGDGWMPAPGWSGEYDWTGYIPFDQLPSALDPPSGRVVTANNKIVPESYAFFLGRGWDLPNRALRINQLLDATPQQSPAASAAIQADTLSLMARQLLPLMLAIEPPSKFAAEALERLRTWNDRMDRKSVAPLIFAAWLRELNRTLFAAKLGDAFDDYWGMHPDVIRLILTKHPEWCRNGAAQGASSCADQLAASLLRALDQLRQRYGSDMAGWRWGRAHRAQFTNQVWASVPVLDSLLATTIPANGGYDTIDRGATQLAAPQPYADVLGPSLRMIVDLSDIDGARFMISPGESGNVLAPHYRDLMRSWRDHAYVTLGGEPVGGTLVLTP
ncbi:MAG TPA: penicillin acylase family protein [Stellaceae bacterium]|nr:penicillin acylase family protein [Stellaceae bacterium]